MSPDRSISYLLLLIKGPGSLGGASGSATRDEVQTMLSRLPDHGIVINFHITFIIYQEMNWMFEVISQLGKDVLHVTLLRERIERGKRWIIHLALLAPPRLPVKGPKAMELGLNSLHIKPASVIPVDGNST